MDDENKKDLDDLKEDAKNFKDDAAENFKNFSEKARKETGPMLNKLLNFDTMISS